MSAAVASLAGPTAASLILPAASAAASAVASAVASAAYIYILYIYIRYIYIYIPRLAGGGIGGIGGVGGVGGAPRLAPRLTGSGIPYNVFSPAGFVSETRRYTVDWLV